MAIRPSKYFILHNGTIIKNLFELSKALDHMPQDIFTHHVNPNKNDFANWIRDVIKDKKLAEKVESTIKNKEIQKFISKKIEDDVLKEINKKKTKIKKTKVTKEIKKENKNNIIQTIKDKIQKITTKEIKSKKEHPYVDSKKTNYGVKCPYKTHHCGLLEFIFGIIIGLIIALVITTFI